MEELENLRSDSEALEKKIVAPVTFNIAKVLMKFSITGICLLSIIIGTTCGAEIDDLIIGTFVSIFIEASLQSMFLIVKYNSENCIKCASSLLICQIICNVIYDFFYIGWGLYITIIYFNINSCGHDFSLTDIIALTVVVYFLVSLSFMICCIGGKLCICLSTLMASAKTGIDRSMSHDLVDVRRNSFVAD